MKKIKTVHVGRNTHKCKTFWIVYRMATSSIGNLIGSIWKFISCLGVVWSHQGSIDQNRSVQNWFEPAFSKILLRSMDPWQSFQKLQVISLMQYIFVDTYAIELIAHIYLENRHQLFTCHNSSIGQFDNRFLFELQWTLQGWTKKLMSVEFWFDFEKMKNIFVQ